jgi:hypothetical protein
MIASSNGDLYQYRSVVTGEEIHNKGQHKDMLKKHGLEEVGNEKLRKHKRVEMPDARAEIAQVMKEKGVIG